MENNSYQFDASSVEAKHSVKQIAMYIFALDLSKMRYYNFVWAVRIDLISFVKISFSKNIYK